VRYVMSALRDYPVWHCREVGAIAMALLDGNVQPHTSYEAGAPL
jgi:hypothetical protein